MVFFFNWNLKFGITPNQQGDDFSGDKAGKFLDNFQSQKSTKQK